MLVSVLGSLTLPPKIPVFFHKTAAIEHQRQRHQGAIGALFFGLTEWRLRIGPALPLKVRIRQIVQGNDIIELEQLAFVRK
jgi:hypothetical protein